VSRNQIKESDGSPIGSRACRLQRMHHHAHGVQTMQIDKLSKLASASFLRFTLCEGSLYRNVIIETAPIRDDHSAVRVTELPGTSPYARRPATIRAHTCNLSFLAMQTPLHIRLCSATPHSRIPDLRRIYNHVPKSLVCPLLLSPTRRQHIPGFRILNLSDPIPLSRLLPFPFMLM
jgi:hypothetical protein